MGILYYWLCLVWLVCTLVFRERKRSVWFCGTTFSCVLFQRRSRTGNNCWYRYCCWKGEVLCYSLISVIKGWYKIKHAWLLINSHQQMHQIKFCHWFLYFLWQNLIWYICWCELINCTKIHGEYNVKCMTLLKY
jgi:hypothetical protein